MIKKAWMRKPMWLCDDCSRPYINYYKRGVCGDNNCVKTKVAILPYAELRLMQGVVKAATDMSICPTRNMAKAIAKLDRYRKGKK